MSLPLIVYGAGGHARVVIDSLLLQDDKPFWAVDDFSKESDIYGIPVISSADPRWQGLKAFRFIVAIGSNQTRCQIFEKLLVRGGTPITLIHPRAVVSPRSKVGLGAMVLGGAVINPGASVGCNVILNTSCSVDHDSFIGDHSHLCPGVRIAGAVIVGRISMIGTGSCVVPGVRIGSGVTVGAGSLVLHSLPDNSFAFGSPVRVRS